MATKEVFEKMSYILQRPYRKRGALEKRASSLERLCTEILNPASSVS